MEIKMEELMSINITIPEIYILTRVINRINNKFYPKDINMDMAVVLVILQQVAQLMDL